MLVLAERVGTCITPIDGVVRAKAYGDCVQEAIDRMLGESQSNT